MNGYIYTPFNLLQYYRRRCYKQKCAYSCFISVHLMFGTVHRRDRSKPSLAKQLNTLDNYLSLSAGNSFKKKEERFNDYKQLHVN